MIAPAMNRPSVLIIDDDRGPRESLRILLKNEFNVHCADSVDAGMELLRSEHPDVIVMDIRMPKKDGLQGLSEIRGVDAHVSIVMLTGYGSMETVQKALRLGATDYLNKPFDTEEMRQVVKRYAQRSGLERKRANMLDQLQQMNQSLRRDLDDKERLAQMGQTSAELIHDLRNPLMIVSGYVDLLCREIEKSRQTMGDEYVRAAEYLDLIQKNVCRCSDLAHMWRKLGKADVAKFAPVPLAQIMDELKASIQSLAQDGGVQIEYGPVPEGVVVNASRAQILRALHNIVANAIQAMGGRDGCVRIACQSDAKKVEMRVEDNGCGMTPEIMQRIFEPYFTTKTQGEGLGLGMAITKRIVEEHEGSIRVCSTAGVGTTMTVHLPIYVEAPAVECLATA